MKLFLLFFILYLEYQIMGVYLLHQTTQTMTNTIYTPNFKLFFGKYKGQLLSSTPISYQVWLVQTEFFKGLTIKYPHKVRKGNSDGTWYEADILAINITQESKSIQIEDNPEKRHWQGYATYLERDSY